MKSSRPFAWFALPLCAGLMACGAPTTLLEVADEPPGAHCADGGRRVTTGVDDDGDGALQPGEIDQSSYLCDAPAGTEPETAPTLLAETTEPAGAHCPDGGTRVDAGPDADGDGVLDPEEIARTEYVCETAPEPADPPASLLSETPEPAGAHCAQGGTRVDAGLDADGDGTLAPEEIEHTAYLCDAVVPLVAVVDEPAGESCYAGGHRVEVGGDADGSGALEAGEVDSTIYVCAGGAGVRVRARLEAAGESCPTGGVRVEVGRDADADGALQPGEIVESLALCNGAGGVPPSCAGWRLGETMGVECEDGTAAQWSMGLEASAGTFVDSGQRLDDGIHYRGAVGDLDGDRDLDVLTSDMGWVQAPWLNDGHGRFAQPTGVAGPASGREVALADVDGDGDLDAVCAAFNGSSVALNDGHGAFTDGASLGDANAPAVAVADLDGDGDPDAVLATPAGAETWLNDGAGGFTLAATSFPDIEGRDVVLGDVDGDGDADLVYLGLGGAVAFNDGAGAFTAGGRFDFEARSGALGDLDGDGDLDLAVVTLRSVPLFFNDGAGGFVAGPVLDENLWSGLSGTLGDADGDGDLDLFVAAAEGQEVWRNDGTGAFAGPPQVLGAGRGGEVLLGDYDGDGDLDAFVAMEGENEVWLNE